MKRKYESSVTGVIPEYQEFSPTQTKHPRFGRGFFHKYPPPAKAADPVSLSYLARQVSTVYPPPRHRRVKPAMTSSIEESTVFHVMRGLDPRICVGNTSTSGG
jgi:hypothetical protein